MFVESTRGCEEMVRLVRRTAGSKLGPKGILLLHAFLFAVIFSQGAYAYKELIERHGELLYSADGYDLYLNNIMTCTARDYGEGEVHSVRAAAIYRQSESLPLGEDFGSFFSSVLLPNVLKTAPRVCRDEDVNVTSIEIDFYIDGFDPIDEIFEQYPGRVADGSARFKDGQWRLSSSGHRTLAEAQAERDSKLEIEAAKVAGRPYGEALEWIRISAADGNVHPPRMDDSKLIVSNDSFSLYEGVEGAYELCFLRSGASGVKEVRLTFLFNDNSEIPGRYRADYERFFYEIEALLGERCEGAKLATVEHYIRGKSHPWNLDEASINRIDLKKDGRGRWEVKWVDADGVIFLGAGDVGEAQLARSGSRDPANWRKTLEGQRMEYADEQGVYQDMMVVLQPWADEWDRLDRSYLEQSGVFFEEWPWPNRPRIELCNRSESRQMRVASAYQISARRDLMKSAPASLEVVMNGWGYLNAGDCKALRTGNAATAFLRIEAKSDDSGWRIVPYETDGDFDGSDSAWQEVSSHQENRFLAVSGVELCMDSVEDFSYKFPVDADLSRACRLGDFPGWYPYMIQFAGNIHYTVELL